MDPGTLLVEQGWQQAGSGYWTNPKIDKGEQRYSLDEAIVKEVQQQQKASEWYKEGHCELLKILDEIKIAFKLECDCAAIPDALISKTAAKAGTEQGANDMHHRSGGAGDERCLICCKDSEGRFKHYDVHEQVYLYIRQLEYAVQHPYTSKIREAYPTRFRGEKTESNAPHHDGCACLACDPKGEKKPRPFCPDCNVPMSKTSDALGGNPRLMCEKCGQTIEADFPAKAKALIEKYGAERLKKALEEIDQESGKPLEQVTDNVLLKADTWGPSPRSDFEIKYIQVQDEIRERLERLEESVKKISDGLPGPVATTSERLERLEKRVQKINETMLMHTWADQVNERLTDIEDELRARQK